MIEAWPVIVSAAEKASARYSRPSICRSIAPSVRLISFIARAAISGFRRSGGSRMVSTTKLFTGGMIIPSA